MSLEIEKEATALLRHVTVRRSEELFRAVKSVLEAVDEIWPIKRTDSSEDTDLERHMRGQTVHHAISMIMAEWSIDKKEYCSRHAETPTCDACGKQVDQTKILGFKQSV